jgi:hypothetical protein
MFIDDVHYTGFQGLPPTVSVNTSQNAQEQNASPGSFTITRTGTSGNLVVNYTISGTATNGADYATLFGTASIPDGAASVVVSIAPMNDALVEGDETVLLTLESATPYFVGGASSAALTIADNDTTLPGDFDSDGDVDGADFVAWQTHFPMATGATLATGDADGDGDVDGADFVAWQTHFPTSPTPGTVVPASGSASVSNRPSAEASNSVAGTASDLNFSPNEDKLIGHPSVGRLPTTDVHGPRSATHRAHFVVIPGKSWEARHTRAHPLRFDLSSIASSVASHSAILKVNSDHEFKGIRYLVDRPAMPDVGGRMRVPAGLLNTLAVDQRNGHDEIPTTAIESDVIAEATQAFFVEYDVALD